MRTLALAALLFVGCGTNGTDGNNGKDGVAGKDGVSGTDGVTGKDGVAGKNGVNGKDGVTGKDGVNGKDGTDNRIVSDMNCTFNNPYYITYSITTLSSGDILVQGATSGYSGANFYSSKAVGASTGYLSINANSNFLYLKSDKATKTATYQVNSGTLYTTTNCTVNNY